jgi:hypothetical protein
VLEATALTDGPDDQDDQLPIPIQPRGWIGDWIAKYKLPVAFERAWNGKGHRWILRDCPFGGQHDPEKAFIVRQASGAVGAGCLHTDCHGKRWPDLRDIFEPGWKEKAQSKNGKSSASEQNLASRLVKSVECDAQLFRGSDGKSYAALEENGHPELYDVESKAFKGWLTRHCRVALNSIASAEALSNAINSLGAAAQGQPVRNVYFRVANLGTSIYIDVGDEQRRAIEVTADGWQVVDAPPVRFRRSHTTASLPNPVPNGDLSELKRFLNYGSEDNYILSVSWLLAALRGTKPYPILIITGPHGAAKSTYAEVLRKLVDPATLLNSRALPKDERDLAISGSNNYALAFTNVSYLSPAMSDALCRMVKGEGFWYASFAHQFRRGAVRICKSPVLGWHRRLR